MKKHQTPNTKHQISSKLQTSNERSDGVWRLKVGVSLVFGFLDFGVL
jgi:hypothetical protein